MRTLPSLARPASRWLFRSISQPSAASLICAKYLARSLQSSAGGPSSQPRAEPVAKTSDTKEDGEEGVPPLPILPRPLGVSQRPTTLPQTWAETRAELLDREKHLQKRQHLVKQATRGYFHDFHQLKHHGGKMWVAPKVLIREDKALYFPDIAGTALNPKEKAHTTTIGAGKISVVSMLSTKISEMHTQSFVTPTLEKFQFDERFKYIQINIQENPLKSFLVSLFLASLRQAVPAHFHSSYLVSGQNLEYLREPLGMENKHIGYVYLVDSDLRVRWAGCGFAAEGESEALANCTRVLVDRLQPAGGAPVEGKPA
ncbi:hypothetical protein BOTBODRAFT_33717 [Botryobasidium botryosum FD-172 SS1]|uniref:Mitochondrial ATPase complex subunit ATP10 n=1 Tax=Botryobasidium botryosum (strain FD-172 SS1) TaxID=930990 RepID=A0A067MNH3_BOTB1|nr:hypothetical protein BOTBODRAFT_33717 [Botryobasidium botryosum FD-172 SS1]